MGKEGPGPRVRSSKGKRSLTLGSTLFSWVSLIGPSNWFDRTGPLFSVFRSLGPLLESLNSNMNLSLFTLCINDSMNESGDSSMQPFSQPLHCMASGLLSLKLSRLNIIVVVSLSESEASKWGRVLCPFVMIGPLPSFQVH